MSDSGRGRGGGKHTQNLCCAVAPITVGEKCHMEFTEGSPSTTIK